MEVMAVMSTTADIEALEDEGGLECQADEEEGREERENKVEGEVVDKISPPPNTSPKCMN